jgi:hypothetical protein
MAEVAAKKPSEQKASEQKTNGAGTVARWNAGGPSSYWDPFGQAPSEFFSIRSRSCAVSVRKWTATSDDSLATKAASVFGPLPLK